MDSNKIRKFLFLLLSYEWSIDGKIKILRKKKMFKGTLILLLVCYILVCD